LEDISADHAQKTVTIDPHPHTGVPSASIHPCKHGSVMKKLVDSARAQTGEAPSVDSYMFVFLKFIASVVPTIEYDYTL
jgi:ubiquitin-like-conjugating enzyme ATG3